MSLATFSKAPMQPQPQRQQASLHTIEITVDQLLLDGPKKESYRALRVVIADGNSVAASSPAKYHGLNTFTPRSLALMNLPRVPPGVVEVAAGMVPPQSDKNPYCSIRTCVFHGPIVG